MGAIDTLHVNGDVAVGRNVATGGNVDVSGSMTVGHNLKVEGWLDAKNIKCANKGLFLSADTLKKMYPRPLDGWYAGVGTSAPFAVYMAASGVWKATGGTMTLHEGTDFTELVELLFEKANAQDVYTRNEIDTLLDEGAEGKLKLYKYSDFMAMDKKRSDTVYVVTTDDGQRIKYLYLGSLLIGKADTDKGSQGFPYIFPIIFRS